MRTIGGKDYYDSARAFGEDPDTVFVRHKHSTAESQKFLISAYDFFPIICGTGPYVSMSRWENFRSVSDGNRNWKQVHGLPVVFCGKVYRGLQFESDGVRNDPGTKQKFFWSFDSFYPWLISCDGFLRVKWNDSRDPVDACREAFESSPVSPETLDILIENRIAVALKDQSIGAKDHHWFINTDGLKDIGFAGAVDPYTAFQELSMFVGGVLPRSPNPMVELTGEKIMTQKHGFDKWSFRRHKDDP